MKRLIGSLLAVTMATLVLVRLAAAETAFLCGDVNQSDDLTSSDALAILRFSVGQPVALLCGPTAPVLRTGQTECDDTAGTLVPCQGSGQDADADRGVTRKLTDLGDGTILDETTSLVWEVLSDDGSIHDRDTVGQWVNALAKAVALNLATFAGHTDWRVPNEFELATLYDFGRDFPALPLPAFHHDCTPGCAATTCSCTPNPDASWSSTTFAFDAKKAWIAQFNDGVSASFAKANYLPARVVRGGYLSAPAMLKAAAPQKLRSAASGNPFCGDVNHDGLFSASDALAVLKAAVGQDIPLVCPPRGGPLRTGQVDCYTSDGFAYDCAGSGEDGERQAGVVRSFFDNGNGTITDQSTGLVWEKLSLDATVHNNGSQYTWAGAFGTKIATLNAANFAGHNDWRVPNEAELLTLVDLGTAQPATVDEFRANCVQGCTVLQCNCAPQSGICWSSTTFMNSKSSAWYVDYTTGVTAGGDKQSLHNVRAVRGGR